MLQDLIDAFGTFLRLIPVFLLLAMMFGAGFLIGRMKRQQEEQQN
jgi:hypothetical protein